MIPIWHIWTPTYNGGRVECKYDYYSYYSNASLKQLEKCPERAHERMFQGLWQVPTDTDGVPLPCCIGQHSNAIRQTDRQTDANRVFQVLLKSAQRKRLWILRVPICLVIWAQSPFVMVRSICGHPYSWVGLTRSAQGHPTPPILFWQKYNFLWQRLQASAAIVTERRARHPPHTFGWAFWGWPKVHASGIKGADGDFLVQGTAVTRLTALTLKAC